jgi:predicted transcriptional regulator
MYTELLPGFEPVGVLLSIRPIFAKLIASGAKTIELRRRFPTLPTGSMLILYATKPIGAVLGLGRLRSTTTATPQRLWRKFGSASGISKQTFDLYFDECIEGLAIEIGDFAPLTHPLSISELRETWPEFTPPQSYRYVPYNVLRKLETMVEPTESIPPSRSSDPSRGAPQGSRR